MSILKVTALKNPSSSANNIVLNTDGNATFNDITASSFNGGQLGGRRNLIINGAMQVAQRGNPDPGITGSGYHSVDRFRNVIINLGTWTITQESVTDLPGFSNSLKMLCTTANASPASNDALYIRTSLEGQDLQHLKKGTSDAESITVSFWVKSNKTGTYVVEVLARDTSPVRHINKSFTVNTSGTWEYKTLTFEGDTTGTIDNGVEAGLDLSIWLGAGTNWNTGTLQTSWGDQSNTGRAVGNVNLADQINNYFQITAVQLEVGDTATPFEHRSYGEELALCQRYYQKYPVIGATSVMFTALAVTGTQARASIRPYGGLMRDEPSIFTPTNVYLKGNGSSIIVTSVAASSSQGGGHAFNFDVTSGLTSNHVYYVTGNQSGGGVFELDAEL